MASPKMNGNQSSWAAWEAYRFIGDILSFQYNRSGVMLGNKVSVASILEFPISQFRVTFRI